MDTKNKIICQKSLTEKKEQLIRDFLNYIDVSKKSQKTYENGLNAFYKYINMNNIKNPTRNDILHFREHIKTNLSISTVNTYMIGVRNFFKWLEYSGIYKNITENVKSVRTGEEHRRNSLTDEQVKQVLNHAKDIREKTIFLLGIVCGLRCNEIKNIQIVDFKEKDGIICLYILGKGRDYKQDFVIVPNELFSLIKTYIKQYEITDYLFVSTSNNNYRGQITTKTLRLIVKNMFKRVGIEGKEYSFHSCRHYFATSSIKNGIDIREVSQALRHKSIATTNIYLHDLEKINNRCSNKVYNSLLNEGN